MGIDLGCKEAATASDGKKLEGRRYRELEAKLGIAQRARNKKRVRNIHATIKNRRLDDMHQFSSQVARTNGLIVVGNVSSQTLVKTNMAKSVLDAGRYLPSLPALIVPHKLELQLWLEQSHPGQFLSARAGYQLRHIRLRCNKPSQSLKAEMPERLICSPSSDRRVCRPGVNDHLKPI